MPARTKTDSPLAYYTNSLPTLMSGIKNWPQIPLTFFRQPITLHLRNGFNFRVQGPMQAWTVKEVCLDLFYNRYFEPQKNWNIVDIGGGVGDFAIMNARQVKRVFSYDKNPITDSLFRQNLEINKAKNVTFHNKYALSLADVLKENKLTKCDLIKLDCEGAEYSLINPAKDSVLKKYQRIVMEYHCFNKDQLRKFGEMKRKLKSCGFKVTSEPNPVHTNIGYLFAKLDQ